MTRRTKVTADNGDGGQRNSSGGWTPRPDPTLLTTQQLIREQAGLKELVLSIVEGNFKVIDTRLIGMDRALQLLHEQQEGRQQVIDVSIGQLRALHSEKFDSIAMNLDERDKRLDERFDGIGTQFQERDKRTEQLSLADKTAIAAALQAQKEAAGATNESSFTALPGGFRNYYAAFGIIGDYSYWWSATEYNANYAWIRYIYYPYDNVYNYKNNKQFGCSVRCLRDF